MSVEDDCEDSTTLEPAAVVDTYNEWLCVDDKIVEDAPKGAVHMDYVPENRGDVLLRLSDVIGVIEEMKMGWNDQNSKNWDATLDKLKKKLEEFTQKGGSTE